MALYPKEYPMDSTYEPMKDYDDCSELGHSQITERVKHFTQMADDAFYEGDNQASAYYLMCAQRFMDYLKRNTIMSAI